MHPDNETIASAQGQISPIANKVNSSLYDAKDSVENDGLHGRIHVRIWAVDDLTTLFTFGSGTFEETVQKMQFVNYQVKLNPYRL